GIVRYGASFLPMDEALLHAAVDISGRPYLVFNVPLRRARLGSFDLELLEDFFRAFSFNAEITLHVNMHYGQNLHHIAEAAFKEGRPFLGICLGYQLLFTESEEFGQGKGLDVIPGTVRRFPGGLKVPHMGWNAVEHRGDLRIFDGIPSGAHFYFVHSYYPSATDPSLPAATCTYGVTFPAAMGRGTLFATQFHPEKSQRWGLKLLE